MFVHIFGAYFGIACSRILYTKDVEESSKEGSVYHSDVFAMIGKFQSFIHHPLTTTSNRYLFKIQENDLEFL